MKKLFFILAMGFLWVPFMGHANEAEPAVESPAPEREQPIFILVSVEKTNGGPGAVFNLYRNISFSSTYNMEEGIVLGSLSCDGDGLSRCSVPRNVVQGGLHNVGTAEMNDKIVNTINELLDKTVSTAQKGNKKTGSLSSKIGVRNGEKGQTELVYFLANWKYDANYNGKVTIQVSRDNSTLSARP